MVKDYNSLVKNEHFTFDYVFYMYFHTVNTLPGWRGLAKHCNHPILLSLCVRTI